jgi:hypothetical protein
VGGGEGIEQREWQTGSVAGERVGWRVGVAGVMSGVDGSWRAARISTAPTTSVIAGSVVATSPSQVASTDTVEDDSAVATTIGVRRAGTGEPGVSLGLAEGITLLDPLFLRADERRDENPVIAWTMAVEMVSGFVRCGGADASWSCSITVVEGCSGVVWISPESVDSWT